MRPRGRATWTAAAGARPAGKKGGAGIDLPPRAALAWGAAGHRVVALIAERHLTATASATIGRLLATDGAGSMADVATHRRPGAWHYVDIPVDAPGYDAERDCPRNQCVVAKIGRYWRILRDGTRSDADREEALKFVIHFVGDVHQPLHAADRHDRGGNEVRVVYDGRDVNLHHVWDTELVEAAEAGAGGQAALVNALDQGSPNTPPRAAPDPIGWANAAHAEAVAVACGALPAADGVSPPADGGLRSGYRRPGEDHAPGQPHGRQPACGSRRLGQRYGPSQRAGGGAALRTT